MKGLYQQGGKYPPMNAAEASAGINPPPMIPSTRGDRIRKGISDVATGVATWGTSFRPPTEEEKKLGRGSWGDRAKLLAGATTQGLTNELIGAGMVKVAGKVASGLVKRFKPNPEAYYRVVEKEAADDMVNSGTVRTNWKTKQPEGASLSIAEKMKARPTRWPSFSKGQPSMEYAAGLKNPHIIETTRPMKTSTMGRHGAGSTQFPTDEAGNFIDEFPAADAKLYKKHWLQGYKEVPLPKPVPAPVTKQPYINVGSVVSNRQQITRQMAESAPMAKDFVDYLNDLPFDEFANYARERGGYTVLGRYFTTTPSGMKHGGLLSRKKARTILHDKEVRGHPLTDKQRRYFGYLSNKKKQEGGAIQRQSFDTN